MKEGKNEGKCEGRKEGKKERKNVRMRVEMNESELWTVQDAGRRHSEQGHAGVR